MGFKQISEIAKSARDHIVYSTIRKNAAANATTNVLHDFSMVAGYPSPNYYASNPLEAKAMRYSTNGGIYHGSTHPTKEKYLFNTMFMGATTGWNNSPIMIMDYLLYYTFIDEGDTDPQIMNNAVSIPRYTDGKGVQIMAVSVAPRTGGASFQITYTNDKGVSGRVTPIIFQNNSATNGGIVSAANVNTISAIPFCPLQAGDTGVRSIESVQMITPDVGLFTLVLVKPLLTTFINDAILPIEKNTHYDNAWSMPKIEDDAYLNIVRLSNNAYNNINLIGELQFIYI